MVLICLFQWEYLVNLECLKHLQGIVYYDNFDLSWTSWEVDRNWASQWVRCVLRVWRALACRMVIWLINALCGGLLKRALPDQSAWGYIFLFAYFSTSESSNFFAERANKVQYSCHFVPYWRKSSCRSEMNPKYPEISRYRRNRGQ